MDEFVRGPLLWMAVIVFVAGFIYRTVRLFQLTEKKVVEPCPISVPKDKTAPAVSAEEQKLERIARLQESVLGRHPVMTVVSTVFHSCLFVTPVLLVAHNVMLHNAFGVRLPTIPDGLSDLLTVVVLGCGIFFLVRRIAVPKVAAISGGYDYGVLLITILPYLTGFMAYHQLLDYKTIMRWHILLGDIMLMVLPFTKVGHMAFFFFSRLTMAGEYCLGRRSRTWST
ncbi:MAG: hypothetical protein C0404_04690 [Verrucomicrobia bacterium]|nr:hypothetical protein [Verrucomicrobiota bacterium]